jgi:hypothetical protein
MQRYCDRRTIEKWSTDDERPEGVGDGIETERDVAKIHFRR